jgi:hypothetical protein
LGAAVASLIALKLLIQEKKKASGNVKNITFIGFGSPKHIDLHHAKLTPEEQAKFSSMISDTSTTPILIQQREALRTIHGSRQNPK